MKIKESTEAELSGIGQPGPDGRSPDGRPVVVDFYVPWCRPCQALVPILEEVAEEYAGRVDFYRIDIDKERRAAVRFGVRQVPALAFVPAEGPYCLKTGAMTKTALREAVETMIRHK